MSNGSGFPLATTSWDEKEYAAIDRVVNMTGLQSVLHQSIETLSKGFRRRVGLAQALVHDPEIVVLDEAEAGLDPQSRIKVREYIQSLARRKTVILTTHNMDEADRVADRVAIIDQGRNISADQPSSVVAVRPSQGPSHSREYCRSGAILPSLNESPRATLNQ